MATASGKSRARWSAFSLEQKIAVIVFCATGAMGFVLSLFFLRTHLLVGVNRYQGDTFLSLSEQEQQEINRQKENDTDGDTISDYDELNIYRTSPYLADSDSDGVNDAVEIAKGDNPNCPTGENCSAATQTVRPVEAANMPTDELAFPDAGLTAPATGQPLTAPIQTEEDLEAFLSTLTTDQIRTALLESGVPAATIDELSDKELRELYDRALQDLSAQGGLSGISN